MDATILEANLARHSIVRRDAGESYEELLTDLVRIDRTRKNKASNKDRVNPHERGRGSRALDGPVPNARTGCSPPLPKPRQDAYTSELGNFPCHPRLPACETSTL